MSLQNTTILAHLTCKFKSFSKLDKKVTAEVAQIKGAESGVVRTHKDLINKEALKKIKGAIGDIKAYHDHMTLPYIERGPRLLPTAKYIEYMAKINGYIADIEIAKNEFLDHWDEHVYEQIQKLGDMGSSADYPTKEQVQRAFKAQVKFYPVPDVNELQELAGMDATEKAKMKEEMKQIAEQNLADTMDDVWKRLHKAVKAFATALGREKGRLHQSLVDNMIDLTELMPSFNLTGDKNLTAMAEKVKQELTNYKMATYKAEPDLRKDIQAKAEQVAKEMEGYF